MTATQTKRLARLLPGGIPRYIRAYDNGDRSADRYIVVFTGRYSCCTDPRCRTVQYVAMSAHPFHPQGVGQHGESERPIDVNKAGWPPAVGRTNHLGRRITWADLPPDCRRLVLSDYRALWNLPK